MKKTDRNRSFIPSMAKFSLLCLFFIATIGIATLRIDAKTSPGTVSVTYGTASPAAVNVGEAIEFSAGYFTLLQDDMYEAHICKNRKFNQETRTCTDGSWCDSSDFTADNPLKCAYTTNGKDDSNNSFFIFVCSESGICSSYFPGQFSVVKNLLELKVPQEAQLKPMKFSFDGQKNAGNGLGDMTITSITAKNSQWSVDVTAQDWENEDGETMDFDGDGVVQGQLTINMDTAAIESADSISDIKLGRTASFSPSLKNINIAAAGKKSGNGTFTIKGIKFDQYVPGNQKVGDYETVLTFTIS